MPAIVSPTDLELLEACQKSADLRRATVLAKDSRVAGPFGAAVRLDVPASTLESKIKALKIDKRRFKSG